MSLKKIESNNKSEVYLSDFEEIVNKTPIIRYNKDTIVIPNICAITIKGKDSFLKRLIHSSEDFATVDENEFQDMLKILDTIKDDTYVLSKESRILPKHDILINLKVLKDNVIFVKSTENVLEVNGIVFTDSELDFQGFGLFTGKEPIFLTYEEMAHIKEILTLLSED